MHQFWNSDETRNFRRRFFRRCRPAGERRRRNPQASAPTGISDTADWTDEQIRERLAIVKEKLNWRGTTGTPRKWWEAFERDTGALPALPLRLAEELLVRDASISEFFYATLFSGVYDTQANLHYFDYLRLKKKEEQEKRRRSGLD